ncbi:MAG: fatty acid desaturase [Actinomycetota bacterium]
MSFITDTLVPAVIAAAIVNTIAMASTTVYLHRTVSHKALSLNPFVEWLFRAAIWLTTGIKPKQWAAVHRKHHAFTDSEGDPHSPVLLGWKKVQAGNVGLYRKACSDPQIIDRYARDVVDDRWDRWFFGHHLFGLGTGIAVLIIVLGPVGGLLAAFIHTNVYLAGNAAVNALGHHFGKRTYDNSAATNLQGLAFFTMGEGLHHNHHAAPSSPRLSHRRGEIDPGWWLIKILAKARLATLRFDDIKLVASARTPAS